MFYIPKKPTTQDEMFERLGYGILYSLIPLHDFFFFMVNLWNYNSESGPDFGVMYENELAKGVLDVEGGPQ